MNRIRELIRGPRKLPSGPFCHVRIQVEVCDPERALTQLCWHLELGLPASKAVVFKLPSP